MLNEKTKGDFMELCADWNLQSSITSSTTEPSTTTLRATTRKTTTTTNKSTNRASTRTSEIISTTNKSEETAFQFSKSFNISKSRNSDENCSKFCEQRFLQSKFNEFASKWADLAKQENSMRSGKVNRKT